MRNRILRALAVLAKSPWLLFAPSTPWKVRLLVAGILGYLILPVDMLPDPFLPVGLLDDFVVGWLLALAAAGGRHAAERRP